MSVRRAIPIVLLSVVAGLLVAVSPSQAEPQTPRDDAARGLVYAGMRRATARSVCAGGFELEHRDRTGRGSESVLCTHGPDPAPEGVDVRQRRMPEPTGDANVLPTGGVASAQSGIPCYGTGTDGYRVQMIYARASNVADRFATYAGSFVQWAARMDTVFDASAAQAGGTRHVRFVTDASCNLVINRVTLSSTGDDTLNNTISELRSQGYNRSDRKYVVWVDANIYCGIAQIYNDDRAITTPGSNYNNGNTQIQGTVARIDNGCWGQSSSVESHELMHNLGGVQTTAPHATPGYHCFDESDRMCYADGSGGKSMQYVCGSSEENRFDCQDDDYFSVAPAPGSWLAGHWNTANSAFLSATAPGGTTTTTTVGPTTTTTRPPSTTTTLAPTTTTTTRPPSTTTTAPPATVPSAPRSLHASQPATGTGVRLYWQAPTTGPVTGYKVYRGTALGQSLLATVGNVTTYTDTNTLPGFLYYYRVTAFNAAGEGPSSSVTPMIAK